MLIDIDITVIPGGSLARPSIDSGRTFKDELL